MSQQAFKGKLMSPQAVILHQVTCLLIASKYDEIDDNITAISDLRDYVYRQVCHQGRRDTSLVPSFNSIVDCERKMLHYFAWDLKFVLPLHFLRAFLANGVLFSNEFREWETVKRPVDVARMKNDWSKAITSESLSIADLIMSKGNVCYRSECSSDIAASIVYLARKNILEADSPDGKLRVPAIWPEELMLVTRCTETQTKRILIEVLRPVQEDPGSARKAGETGRSHQQRSTQLKGNSGSKLNLPSLSPHHAPNTTKHVTSVNKSSFAAGKDSLLST